MKKNYNRFLSANRVIIEGSFGLLKGRRNAQWQNGNVQSPYWNNEKVLNLMYIYSYLNFHIWDQTKF